MAPVIYRDLATLDEFAAVVALERSIWGPGYDEVVPTPILTVSINRGGILIGAFEGERMIGFVYSLAGIKHGKPTQWSHMLGVVPEYRGAGVGRRLKLMQRERALEMGLDLIEWTYDPMQAMNAHLNFQKLGVVVEEYEENIYGESTSPLHKGNPTDRFVAEWWIGSDRVTQRISGTESRAESGNAGTVVAANRTQQSGPWSEPTAVDTRLDACRVGVEIPMGFTDMLMHAPDLALAWRIATRQIFTSYFSRGYRASEFVLDRAARRGTYLLTR
jgi:predicted GNAT superfamily acetyltransferase